MIKIQYSSDLHINDYPKGTPFESFITPIAPILVIAGDICSVWNPLYAHFVSWCSRHWSIVIIVLGNHEYFSDGQTMNQSELEATRICAMFHNVKLLQSGASYVVPGTTLRFVGATLWSAVEPTIWEAVAAKKGDYRKTYTQTQFGIRNTQPSDICALHALHKARLSSAIAPHAKNETLIVITHHMPTLNLLEESYRHDTWRSCYASADDELFKQNVKVWICGHSHRAIRWQSPSGPVCVMNARGYNSTNELYRTQGVYNPQAYFVVNI